MSDPIYSIPRVVSRPTYRYSSPMTENPLGDCSTTIFISNLHCSSCVRTIESALFALSPRPLSVEVSVVSQSVTVQHGKQLSAQSIESAIDNAGFDVVQSSAAKDGSLVATLPSFLSTKHKTHMEQCSLCKEQLSASAVSLNTSGGDIKEISAVPPGPDTNAGGPLRVTLSVSGMTCSSCTNSITRAVSELHGVSDVTVSLLERSATAIVEHRKLVDLFTETVEDCGFEAQVVSVESAQSPNEPSDSSRTISLRVDGMFCPHCPEKVMKALDIFDSRLRIIKPITTFTDPILTLSYHPAPPSLTIRTIMNALASAKSPPFTITIPRPPSLEELSRSMQIREQRSLLLRLIFSVIAAIPTFILGIVYMTLVRDGNPVKMYLMEPMWTGNVSRTEWALFFLATPVMFYGAGIFHRRSIRELRALWKRGSTTPISRRFIRFGSMNLLVSTGVSVAYFASIALFDSVVFLRFDLTGRFLEAYSKARTADAITALGLLKPAEAHLLVPRATKKPDTTLEITSSTASDEDLEKGSSNSDLHQKGFEIEAISVDLLEVGDVVRVRSGSSPPADGTVISTDLGEHIAFDESSLTGESRPVVKQGGDRVFLGTINKSKMPVHVRVDAIGGGTMLDHIVKVVREGQTRRAPIERLADALTGYFVPVVTLLAIVTWIIWLSLGMSGSLPQDYLDIEIGGWPVWSLEFAIAVFVVACPCGIGLAAPTALLVGSGLAAKFGILARGGGEAFQEMAQLDLVVFDKTGTLTEGGEPRVSDAEIITSPDIRWERNVILSIASEIETASSHPLAIAIQRYCEGHGAAPSTGSAFEETAGRGLKARFDALHCMAIIGNEAWIQAHGVIIDSAISQRLEVWKSEGKSVILLALQDELPLGGLTAPSNSNPFHIAGIFAVTDPLRPEAVSVISWLQRQGLNTWMISGDNAATAGAVAKTVGIPSTNVIAGVLPHEKAEKIQQLQLEGRKRQEPKWRSLFGKSRLNDRCIVAMVGDGINDAPALTAADVGIAIGSGSDVAISSASFILLSSNLQSLITLSDLSRRVFNRVKFNFLWAVMYNCICLPIAAGVLYPAGHARLDPVWASLAMALSSVSVVCSSLLLKLYKEPIMKKPQP